MTKKVGATLELRFNTEEEKSSFVSAWLDGGGEQTCGFYTLHEFSDDWTKSSPKWIFLEDNGEFDD